MTIIKLPAEMREQTGSHASRAIRAAGYIPANLYHEGQPSILLKLNALTWSKHLTEQINLVNIEMPNGDIQMAAVREIQREPFSQSVIHVDLLAVRMDQKTEFHVKLDYIGNPVGLKEGGVKTILAEYISVECLPGVVPDSIQVDISKLKVGDSIDAGHLPLPDGIHLVSEPATTLITIMSVRSIEGKESGEGQKAESESEDKKTD